MRGTVSYWYNKKNFQQVISNILNGNGPELLQTLEICESLKEKKGKNAT